MNGQRFMNRPVKVFWAGWESDTFQLAKQGWQISAEQNPANLSIRLVIRHPKADVMGMSEIERYAYDDIMNGSPLALPTVLRFQDMTRQIMVNVMGGSQSFDFNPIDPIPKLIDSRVESLEDLANFAPLEISTEQVYLREANMAEILKVATSKEVKVESVEDVRRLNLDGVKVGKLHTELRVI